MKNLMFRAWDNAKKKWIDGAYGFHILGESMLIGGLFQDYKILDLNNIIIEQFTGLLDKNGKEIYKGDIVHIWSDFYKKNMPIAEVYWNNTGAKFDIKEPNGLYNDWLSNSHQQGWFIEVIGNIHEHKNLFDTKAK